MCRRRQFFPKSIKLQKGSCPDEEKLTTDQDEDGIKLSTDRGVDVGYSTIYVQISSDNCSKRMEGLFNHC